MSGSNDDPPSIEVTRENRREPVLDVSKAALFGPGALLAVM